MAVCPLCLLGMTEPHTREDWKRLAGSKELQAQLERIQRENRIWHNLHAHGRRNDDTPCKEHIG